MASASSSGRTDYRRNRNLETRLIDTLTRGGAERLANWQISSSRVAESLRPHVRRGRRPSSRCIVPLLVSRGDRRVELRPRRRTHGMDAGEALAQRAALFAYLFLFVLAISS